MRIVITGAAGNIGRKLTRHLAADCAYQICRIDRDGGGDPDIVEADLGIADARWMDLLEPGDTIVHLAAQANPAAAWTDLVGPNLDAVLHLYAAAARIGARRIVLASSVWVMHGHRGDGSALPPETPPDPGGNAYGLSKLFAERTATALATERGLDTVIVRLGACRPNNDDTRTLATNSLWTQQCWLSDDDCCRGLEAAIRCERPGVTIVNLISDVEGSPWSMAETRALLGFVPQDRYRPQISLRQKPRAMLGRWGWRFVARLSTRLMWWE